MSDCHIEAPDFSRQRQDSIAITSNPAHAVRRWQPHAGMEGLQIQEQHPAAMPTTYDCWYVTTGSGTKVLSRQRVGCVSIVLWPVPVTV